MHIVKEQNMLDFWKSLTFTTKFSGIAFLATMALGLLSMDALGGLLYYPVSFLFSAYPTLNDWRGDWLWPKWFGRSVLFLGGLVWHFLDKLTSSKFLLTATYLVVLWGWAAMNWYLIISRNVERIV